MTTAPHKTRQNKIISLVSGLTANQLHRFIPELLITDGWVAWVNAFLENEVFFKPDEVWHYLPWGYDGGAYDFCALLQCTGEMARAADPIEFLAGQTVLYKNTRVPIGFYMGNPATDPTLYPLWTASRTAWLQRVEASIFPIALVKAKGIPVRFGIDGAGNGYGADQCMALLDHLSHYGPVSYEPRPLVPGAALNIAKYGSITQDFAYRDDFTGFGLPPIPAAQLRGPKILLCQNLRMPGDYAAYVRKVGQITGADIMVSNNPTWRGRLTAAEFRATLAVSSVLSV